MGNKLSDAAKAAETVRENLVAILIVFGVAAVVIGGVVYGVWYVASLVSPVWARVWAVMATFAIPICCRTFYVLGQTEARGKLHGIDAGIDRVTRAAAMAVDMRASGARTMIRAQESSQPVVDFPPVFDVLELASGEEVVEL